jgi:hypothetical protein
MSGPAVKISPGTGAFSQKIGLKKICASELAIVLKGKALHLIGKDSAPIETGDVLVIHPGYLHAYDKTDGMELINIVYKKEKLPLPMLDGFSFPLFQILFPLDEKPSPEKSLRPVMLTNSRKQPRCQGVIFSASSKSLRDAARDNTGFRPG